MSKDTLKNLNKPLGNENSITDNFRGDDLARETQAARYWNMRYHQVVQERDEFKSDTEIYKYQYEDLKVRNDSNISLARSQIDDLKISLSYRNARLKHINAIALEAIEIGEGFVNEEYDGTKHFNENINKFIDLRQKLGAAEAMPIPKQEPVFYYRPTSSGGYEGPIWAGSIEKCRIDSGVWKPLFAEPQPAQAAAIPEGKLIGILDMVESSIKTAYCNAYPVCCGKGGESCCGSPDPEWSSEDKAVISALEPLQKYISEMLTAAPKPDSAGGES